LGLDGSSSVSSSSSIPKSKQRSWNSSAVNLLELVSWRSGTIFHREGGMAGYLLLAQLLEESVLIDADGRHIEPRLGSSRCSDVRSID
jgi:hypothetical protein